jgi:hypothetical protein
MGVSHFSSIFSSASSLAAVAAAVLAFAVCSSSSSPKVAYESFHALPTPDSLPQYFEIVATGTCSFTLMDSKRSWRRRRFRLWRSGAPFPLAMISQKMHGVDSYHLHSVYRCSCFGIPGWCIYMLPLWSQAQLAFTHRLRLLCSRLLLLHCRISSRYYRQPSCLRDQWQEQTLPLILVLLLFFFLINGNPMFRSTVPQGDIKLQCYSIDVDVDVDDNRPRRDRGRSVG